MPPKTRGGKRAPTKVAKKKITPPSPSSSGGDDDVVQVGEKSPRDPTPPPESPAHSQDSSKAPARKRQKVPAVDLTDEQEIDMSDWLKTNNYLYTKGTKKYKNTQMKNHEWEKKGTELGVDHNGLFTWYESIRTKVGKLTDDKSGSAARQLTDRDQFILDHFRFLADHIVRQPTRSGISVSILQLIMIMSMKCVKNHCYHYGN